MATYVVLISLFLLEAAVGDKLLRPTKKCVPTSTIAGACHVCMCSIDGIYQCHEQICRQDLLTNPPISRQRIKDLPEIKEGEPCTTGKSYRMDCNRCHCSEAQTLVCTKTACVDWSNFINHKSGKLRREPKVTKLRTGLKAGKSKRPGKLPERTGKLSGRTGKPSARLAMSNLPKWQKEKCVPGKIYKKGCRRCFCNNMKKISCSEIADGACKLLENGLPSPILAPEDVRPPFVRGELKKAPSLSSASQKCEPGLTYIVSCNKCICTEMFNLLCTRSLCLSFDDINRVEAEEKTGKKCMGNKVTKESCVECRCVQRKLACKRILDCITETKTKLSKTANSTSLKIEIDPVRDNCIPGAIYKDNCNHCYCQPDASLRCTQKTCLNYAQSKLLDEQFELLEKEGL